MMRKPTILVTRRMPPAVEARLKRDYDARLNPDDRIYSSEELIAKAAGADGMLICSSDKITPEVVAHLPESVKIIATFSVGYEHIDVMACEARGVIATNTPGVLTDATADIAFLLILAAARRAYEAQTMLRQGQWTGWHTTMLLGIDLAGKRLGIFGMGRIGQAVARRALGFGMEIHYHNRSRLPQELEAGATYHPTLESLLQVSDVLSINAPSTPETRNILNAERIALLPDGAIVVNTARGDMVDDAALIGALRSGKLRAAGLDVFAGEPNLNKEYLSLPNAYLLPHIGSATIETRDRMGFTALDNLDAVLLHGRPAPNRLW
ncbi:D-glycerate dehydrogenase [uncultured Ferrovibrio sp.]|jgi:lactate dehydrogenase-like 2-hydroxyacid dehydrogenase|uniref:2-hydroxyacid dehydrogenase n=1 Tax=uncultured Ferrovibrio sp. TaxID=1576913 RepID=UPI0026305D8E|nr:D-glycerate dehydrogenase [uncultured Ferrovibrio sp.]